MKHFLKCPSSIWNFIPNHIFSQLQFLSLCNYNIGKWPVKLSAFHKQMLLAWSLIYKHNFSPHCYFIWNNQNILFKNRSLFFPNWYDNSIILVRDLLNEDGLLYTYGFWKNVIFLSRLENLPLFSMLYPQVLLHCLKVLKGLFLLYHLCLIPSKHLWTSVWFHPIGLFVLSFKEILLPNLM